MKQKLALVVIAFFAVAGIANAQQNTRPLKVFILAGQSNMQGHAQIATFESMATDPLTVPLLKQMQTAEGKPKVCEKVWISSVGCLGDRYSDLTEMTGKLKVGFGANENKIGPEYTFGLTMEQVLGEPILIIKTAWGGRSLHTDFRPPSGGPYVWSEYELERCKKRGDDLDKIKAEKLEITGKFYREMIKHVQKVLADIKRVVPDYDEKQGYELAGFVWFQGFNDLVSDWTYQHRAKPDGYDLYADLLAHLIRDVRKDLSSPKLPFVIGVMGIDGLEKGNKPPQLHFRQAQRQVAALPEFHGTVVAVETAPYWDDELANLAERMESFQQSTRRKLNESAKTDSSLTPQKINEAIDLARLDKFTPDEIKRLKAGVSNGGYHYLGAAKIMAPIGKAFAEVSLSLLPGAARSQK